MANAKKQILLFVGNDITANLVVNRAVADIIKRGYEPVLLFPKHVSSKKAQLPEIINYAHKERTLFNDVIAPYLDKNPHPAAFNKTRQQLTQLIADEIGHELGRPPIVHDVENVNDPAFINWVISNLDLKAAINIRGFQIFHDEIINVLKEMTRTEDNENGAFLNLHPAPLPEYRGVMSTPRAMADRKKNTGWTGHHMERGIDTGNIIDYRFKAIDYEQCALTNTIRTAGLGAELIRVLIEQLESGNAIEGLSQDMFPSKAQYYTFPLQSELDEWDARGIIPVDKDSYIAKVIENYSLRDTHHAQTLARLIEANFNAPQLKQNFHERAKVIPAPPMTAASNDMALSIFKRGLVHTK